ncbi:MAG: CHAT domain-containing protein, partial [Oscillochloris sp.]|nr:CHAT domain-containing protein [Oscillochloris sp.]
MSVVDLDLIIASYSDGTTAEIQLHRPEQQVASLLAPPTTWPFDPSHLARHILDSVAYGQALSEQLFAAQPLLMAWHEASAYAKGHQARLRLRLILPVNAPELQALRWETLYDPVRHVPLASSDRVWLVRLPSTTSLEMIKPPPRSGLRATVVVANPRNLAGYQLGPIDVDGEIARARRALGSACSIIIGDHEDAIQRQASLSAILTALRQAPHILYLVCHGKTENGETQLCLEGDLGEAIWLRGSMLVEAIENLSPPPLMTMLIACRSAGDGYGDALNVLGPQLARAGIPAVLGFQGDVAQRTVRRCMAILWDEIRKDGRIDRALTIARREIGQDLWWQPVLWLRAADGRLWRDDPSLPLASSIETIEQISKQTGLSPELRDLSAA